MEETTPEGGREYDKRTPDQIRYDAISDQLRDAATLARDLAEIVKEAVTNSNNGHTQTVIHKSEGMGAVGILCAVVSVCCVLMMGGFFWMISIELNKQTAELHDLRAWRDIHQNHISAIEAREEKRK